MSEFKFECPECRQRLQCDTGCGGQTIACPACAASIIIPAPPSQASVVEVSPPGPLPEAPPFNLNRFKTTLIYECRAPLTRIQADIEKLRSLDRQKEASKGRWQLVIVVAILMVIGLGYFKDSLDGMVGELLSGILLGAMVVTGVVGIFASMFHGKHDLENRRYELADRVLALLATDSSPAEQASIRVDLRKTQHQSKFTRKGRVGVWRVKYYKDPWFSLSGRLMDGTSYLLGVTELLQVRKKTSHRGGKTKFKTKTKSAMEASLVLKPKSKRYPGMEELTSNLRGVVRLPGSATLKRIQGDSQSMSIRAVSKGDWRVAFPGGTTIGLDATELIASMFLSFYQVLNLARSRRPQGP